MLDKTRAKIRANKRTGESLARQDRGQVQNMAMQAVSLVVALTVGAIVAAFLLPVAIEELVNVSTTNWSSGASSIWGMLDMIIILAVFLFFIGIALASAERT